jgi:hypothetical protein
MKLMCKSDIYEKKWDPSESIFCSGNHVHKTELTIGSYYDLSMKVTYQKNPFILFYVMMEDISFQNQL